MGNKQGKSKYKHQHAFKELHQKEETKEPEGRKGNAEYEMLPVAPTTPTGQYSEHPKKKQQSSQLIREAKQEFYRGNQLFREAKFQDAKEEFLRAIEKLQHCDNHIHAAMAYTNIGVLEFAEGRYEEANKLLNEALEIHKNAVAEREKASDRGGFRSVGYFQSAEEDEREEHDENFHSLSCLSIAVKRDILANSIPSHTHERAIASELKDHGTLDAMIADLLNNLAACHEVIGQLNEARQLYEESLHLRTVVYGPKSLKAAESMQNLATILDTQGHLSEAEKLLTEALAIEVDILGEEDIEIAVTMNNLGVLLAHVNKLSDAKELLEKSVQMRKKVYGADHHLTNCAQQNLEYVQHRIEEQAAHGEGMKKDEGEGVENKEDETQPEESRSHRPFTKAHYQVVTDEVTSAEAPENTCPIEEEVAAVKDTIDKINHSYHHPSEHVSTREEQKEQLAKVMKRGVLSTEDDQSASRQKAHQEQKEQEQKEETVQYPTIGMGFEKEHFRDQSRATHTPSSRSPRTSRISPTSEEHMTAAKSSPKEKNTEQTESTCGKHEKNSSHARREFEETHQRYRPLPTTSTTGPGLKEHPMKEQEMKDTGKEFPPKTEKLDEAKYDTSPSKPSSMDEAEPVEEEHPQKEQEEPEKQEEQVSPKDSSSTPQKHAVMKETSDMTSATSSPKPSSTNEQEGADRDRPTRHVEEVADSTDGGLLGGMTDYLLTAGIVPSSYYPHPEEAVVDDLHDVEEEEEVMNKEVEEDIPNTNIMSGFLI